MGKGFSKSQEAKLHDKACLAFLDKVLQKILQGQDDAQVMLFLEANLDKLDHNFAKLLRSWGISKRTQGQLRQAEKMAAAINIFSNLIQELGFGSKANNLEIAITGYKVAAPFLTRNVSPKTWAETQNNMGNAYCNRIYGEQPENLEQALCCYKAALQVYTKEKFPKDWAWTLNLLGTVYHDRLRDNQEKNLEKAICCYKAALQVYTENKFPQGWADTNNNLGNAYCQRIQDNKEDNLERSIGCYESALQIYNQDQEKYTQECIKTQNNLGNAYSKRIRGKSKENIDLAISSYQAGLKICLLELFPEDWATLRNNLGNAYRHCTQNNNIENLEVAIECYLDALKVRTRSNFPKDHVLTQFNLGITYLDAQQFDKSYSALAVAIETVESLRSEIIYGSRKEEDRQRLAEQWNKLYQRMVEVCLELGYYDQAIEYAERSKTRNLVEQILTRDLKSIVTQEEDFKKLEKLRYEIASGQYDIQNAKSENPTALAQHLQQLRQRRNQLQDSYMPIGYGFNFDKFQETVDDRTAIIEWYITGTQILTFIITRQSPGIEVWPSTPADLQALIAWNDEYLQDLKQNRPHWQKQLPNRLKTLAEILHLNEILTLIPETCHQLILIPHRFLHLFPLHALPLADGTYLLDCDRCRAGLRYAPSCQLLQLTQEQKRSDFSRLFAIQDPEQNLLFANSVVETIRHYFPGNSQILVREEATKETLNNAINAEFLRLAHCLLFSGHGVFNYESPLQSCLKLANNTRLTLGEIFSMNLSQCSLVTLSACETGLADPTSISDEYISLPSGFLFAGTPRVVCSLWEVSSISTTLLIREFYKNLFENFRTHQNLDFVLALNKAQKWLRELTSQQCEAIVRDEIEPQVQEIIKQLPGKRRRYQASLDAAFNGIRDRQPHPFASPYYWAAFTVTGS